MYCFPTCGLSGIVQSRHSADHLFCDLFSGGSTFSVTCPEVPSQSNCHRNSVHLFPSQALLESHPRTLISSFPIHWSMTTGQKTSMRKSTYCLSRKVSELTCIYDLFLLSPFFHLFPIQALGLSSSFDHPNFFARDAKFFHPVPGSLFLCRCFDTAAISFLRGCPP